MKIESVIGDAAYSEKGNIECTNKKELKLVAKLNPSVTQGFDKKTTLNSGNEFESHLFDTDI